MKRRINILLFSFIFVLAGLASNANASTSVSGNIANPVWTAENSPYIISSSMEVLPGAKLVISPGVVVKFEQGAKLIIKGELEAIGEENNRIVFTSNQDSPQRGDWSGIEFADTAVDAVFDENGQYVSGSILKYVDVKYSEAVLCTQSSPYISKSLFLNNNSGVNIVGEGGLDVSKMVVEDSTFVDNGIGILINRENSNSYVSTPAGMVRQGEFIETAILQNNVIQNNVEGIVARKGDNNAILGNRVNNNKSYGIKLETGSQNCVLERNYINNNKPGLSVESRYSKIRQNNINHNLENGVILAALDVLLTSNNIYGNAMNLSNGVSNADIKNNYWGSSSNSTVNALIKDNTGSGTVYEPFKTEKIGITELWAPTLVDVFTPTVSGVQTLSGTKQAQTAVYINGQKVIDLNNDTEWTYKINLNLGDNDLVIFVRDEDEKTSPTVETSIYRDELIVINDPTLDYYPSTTKEDKVELTGNKDRGTGVWINSKKVVDVSDSITWSYTVSLSVGANTFNVSAQDADGNESGMVEVVITKEDVSSSEIIAEEKALTKSVDSALSKRLAGMILLQVEQNGQAWYVNPADYKRYYLGRPNDTLTVMKKFGLGVNDSYMSSRTTYPDRLLGKILINVDKGGEAYYVYPKDKKAYFLGRPENAFAVMKQLGLGISNENIRKISVGE